MMPATAGRPERRSEMRATLRRICSTPSALHAAGSATISTRSAANSAFTVRSPSEGAQSIRTSSYPSATPSSATARRSCAPITSVASRCSHCARRGELGARSTAGMCSPWFHPEGRTTVAREPLDSWSSADSMVRSASHTPMPVVAFAWGSRSMTRTRRPRAEAAAARPRVTVVFPTPPFWFTTAVMLIPQR